MEPTSAPNPDLVFDTLVAYQRSAALTAAIQLDLFSAFGGGVRGAAELAGRLGAAERGIRILCDYMTILGLLEKRGDRYGLSPTAAAFLDRGSPAYLGSMATFLTHETLQAGFWRLAEAVRHGGTAVPGGGTLAPENPIWVEFARAMEPMARFAAPLLVERVASTGAAPAAVLDVAGGHGVYGIAFGERYPGARVTTLDWPNVLEVARANAAKAGLESRLDTIAGSALEVDWRGPYDIVLLTNFLHHFDFDTCVSILGRARAALAPGGRAVTLEFVPNPDRVTPPQAAGFSLVMLAGTPSGDAYTGAQLDEMAARAGFAKSELYALEPGPQKVHVCYR